MNKAIVAMLFTISFMACNDTKNRSTQNREFIPEPDKNKSLTAAENIAYSNGLAKWDDVSEISFTFNVDRADTHFERSWTWNPKADKVRMMTKKDTISFSRDSITDDTRNADASFINDKYWLLAPYQLVWDKGTTTQKEENVIAPISKEKMNKLTLTYGDEGGYTPGDAYDFYYDDNFIIKEWVFRKGNDSIPTSTTTWENYKDYKGLNIATMHQDSTRSFKLYFTDISVN